MQLHQPSVQRQFQKLNATLVVVSFSGASVLAEWVAFFRTEFLARSYRENGLELPDSVFARTIFLSDPELTAYHAYGLGRMSPLRAFGFKNLWRYVRWSFQGKLIAKWYGDPFQRGGDFVVGSNGLITLAHTGPDQANRPAPQRIIEALRA